MTKANKPINDQLLLDELKEIILREERRALSEVEKTLSDRALLAQRVNPIIEEHLSFLKQHFPEAYQQAVDKQIEARLTTFKQEMLGLLYPELGKMIRKYITLQFQVLKERIDTTVRSAFSFETVKRKFRATFLGVDESDLLLSKLDVPVIEEVYIIQRESGLLLGKASREETLDQDVVAGMLTAIKAFVEDAFRKEREDLEMIQYGSHKIFIQNFYSYYIAVAMRGSLSAQESEALSARLQLFAKKELSDVKAWNDHTINRISAQLETYFELNDINQPQIHSKKL